MFYIPEKHDNNQYYCAITSKTLAKYKKAKDKIPVKGSVYDAHKINEIDFTDETIIATFMEN